MNAEFDPLKQNPEMPAPEEILSEQRILQVNYYGFDSKIHTGEIVVNIAITNSVKKFFEQALALKFPIEKIIPISHPNYSWNDELSCSDNNSSGFNFRYIAQTATLSKHAKGLAFDINPVQNPYIKYNEQGEEILRIPNKSTYCEDAPGTLCTNHPLVIFLKGEGFDWGGDWTKESGRIDYQHFEFSGN